MEFLAISIKSHDYSGKSTEESVMYLLLFTVCLLVGFPAMTAFLSLAALLRDKPLGAYASIIGALTLIIIADASYAFCLATNYPLPPENLHTALVIIGQAWFAFALPYCVSAVIRQRLTRMEVLFSSALALSLCITSLLASGFGVSPFAAVDDVILLFSICYASARCIISFRFISEKLKPFIRIAVIVNVIAVSGNCIYIIVSDIAGERYQLGLVFYYLAWNIFNLLSIFLYLMKHPENSTIVRAALSLAVYTEREKQIIELICEGRTNEDIADTFGITLNTVKQHIRHIFRKAGIHSRMMLIAMFGHNFTKENRAGDQ